MGKSCKLSLLEERPPNVQHKLAPRNSLMSIKQEVHKTSLVWYFRKQTIFLLRSFIMLKLLKDCQSI